MTWLADNIFTLQAYKTFREKPQVRSPDISEKASVAKVAAIIESQESYANCQKLRNFVGLEKTWTYN